MNKWAFLVNIHIHPLFWVIFIFAILNARFFEMILLFIIVLIHELGHAFAAASFSWKIKRIVLLPFGGVAETDEHGKRPLREEVIVILAGPAQHLWLIALGKILFLLGYISNNTYETFLEFNLMVLAFNCLPIYPLDGGKLLYYFYAKKWPFLVALERAILTSLCFLVIFCFTILVISPLHLNGWIIAGFLLYSLYQEWKNRPYTFIRFLLERYQTDSPPLIDHKKIYASKNDSLSTILSKFYRGSLHSVIVSEQGKNIAQLAEAKCIRAYFERDSLPLKINDLLS